MLLVWGCSSETPIATNFILNNGSEITFHHKISTSYPDKELIFELSGIPETKKDRDFSDYMDITLTDVNGETYKPEKTWDVNGSRRDIIAICNNIPRGTKITTIKIVALNNLKVLKVRWWNGKLQ
ncbi:hypothetical protein ACFL03_14710 [Thermodesulfobacteriota bacterium]